MKALMYYSTAIALLLAAVGCGINDRLAGSGSQTTNGNCVGTIYNADGTVADGATVRLFPHDFNPLSHADSLVDSTVTDKNGRFSFMVKQLRKYNVIAQKASASCMDSIELIPNATTVVTDTLRQSGFISGAVRLQNPDTANSIVVLVMGTSIYAMPSDTSGKFTTPLLAAGAYTLRIFSTQSGYAVFDTVVIVDKGAETRLPVTVLPSANAPSVNDFSLTLDSLTMYATFAWSQSDTDGIVSYSVHRTSKKGNDSLIMLDKSLTSTTDDVLMYEGDTLTYQIAANGKSFKEGFLSKPLIVIPRQEMRWDKRIVMKWDVYQFYLPAWLLVDYKGNMFLGDNRIIQKFDENGNALTRYAPDSGDFSYITQRPQADESGNIYLNQSDYLRHRIIQFDADLNKRKELILRDSNDTERQTVTIAVAGNGNLLVIRDSADVLNGGETRSDISRSVTVYDSNFAPHDEYAFKNIIPIFDVTRFGDTFVAEQWFVRKQQLHYSVGWYDQRLNALSVMENFDYVNKFRTPECFGLYSSFGGPSGLIFTTGAVENVSWPGCPLSLFLVSTADKKLVARLLVPTLLMGGGYFDRAGNFYSLVDEVVDGNRIEVLYRYPMAPLFGAGDKRSR